MTLQIVPPIVDSWVARAARLSRAREPLRGPHYANILSMFSFVCLFCFVLIEHGGCHRRKTNLRLAKYGEKSVVFSTTLTEFTE
jgi:hypothetical protein